jgi:hypothetical protein
LDFSFFVCGGVYIQQGRKRTSEHHPRGKGGAPDNRGLIEVLFFTAASQGKSYEIPALRSRELLQSPPLCSLSGVVRRPSVFFFAGQSLTPFFCLAFFFWEGLSLQAKQRSAPPQKPRACLSQVPTKRGVCASVPAALLEALFFVWPFFV